MSSNSRNFREEKNYTQDYDYHFWTRPHFPRILNAVRVWNLDVLLDSGSGSFRQRLHILFKISGNKNSIWRDKQSFSTPMTQCTQKSFLRWLGNHSHNDSASIRTLILRWLSLFRVKAMWKFTSTRNDFPLHWVNMEIILKHSKSTHTTFPVRQSQHREWALKTWINMKYYSASPQSNGK